MYVTLEEIQAKETLSDATLRAKLKGRDLVEVTITVKAKTREELQSFIPLLRKGAIFEVNLQPLRRENSSLADFQLLEVLE